MAGGELDTKQTRQVGRVMLKRVGNNLGLGEKNWSKGRRKEKWSLDLVCEGKKKVDLQERNTK